MQKRWFAAMSWSLRRDRRRSVVAGLAIAAGLAGCTSQVPYTELPSITKDTRSILTDEQQKAAVGDLTAKKEASRTEALKEIEGKK